MRIGIFHLSFVYMKYNYIRQGNGLKTYSRNSIFTQGFVFLRKVDLNNVNLIKKLVLREKGQKVRKRRRNIIDLTTMAARNSLQIMELCRDKKLTLNYGETGSP